jgi:ligand-binding sensor domain-containing protein
VLPADGRVCVGTAGGLATFGSDDQWTLDEPTGDVRALCTSDAGDQDRGVWILTWPGRVRRWREPPAGSRPRPPGPPLALAMDGDGRPHIVTERALWRLDADRPHQVAGPPPAPARCLAQLRDGTWWLGTTDGAGLLNPGAERWELAGEPTGPVQAEITALLVQGDILWGGAANGLWAREYDAWTRHGPASPADPWQILARASSSEPARLWLARSGGVVSYDVGTRRASEPWTPFNSGLPGRRVTALLEHHIVLWVVTRTGFGRMALL